MSIHPGAGRPAPDEVLVDLPRLVSDYYTLQPDPAEVDHRVHFGTSGHRGSALDHRFNQAHLRAIVQAVCDVRAKHSISGPMFVGKDTHALSEPAWRTAIEVLVGNDVPVLSTEAYVPTPLVSRALLEHNGRHAAPADGLIITPSHNPPSDGGIKYNPPHGGPSESSFSAAIEARANELLGAPPSGVPFGRAWRAVQRFDFVGPYVEALTRVVKMDAIRRAGLKLGADPLGGSAVAVWDRVAEAHRLDLRVVNPRVDGTFRFMTLDGDGKIRMDCSSPYAMANLVQAKDQFAVSFGNDTDADRHGIVTPGRGLFNPNHFLAILVDHLFESRDAWPASMGAGQTVVTSALVRRAAEARGRSVIEVPVGFKWFVPLLVEGKAGFAGEESAGATVATLDGQPWTTDKDGIVVALLAAEIAAVKGRDLDEVHRALTDRLGAPAYRRIDAPASRAQKKVLRELGPEDVVADQLAGHRIVRILTRAPGNDEAIGGLKVETEQGWFAARPSGTEDVYKIYGESFEGEDHLQRILDEAKSIVDDTFQRAGVS